MRFVLDNDVDAGVGKILRGAGHECWKSTAGLDGEAEDDDVSVYADDRNAVVVTHDKEFTERRKRNTFGKHVRLTCLQPDACDVVSLHLDELESILAESGPIVIEVSSTQVKRFPPKWT